MATLNDLASADDHLSPADAAVVNQDKVLASGQYARRVGMGAAFQFVAAVGQQVLRFAASWLIARLLGRTELGVFTLSLTFWTAVQMSYGGGLARSVTRFSTHHIARGELPEAKGAMLLGAYCAWIGGGILALLLYLGADAVAVHVLNRPETAASLRIMALCMPITGICTVIWSTARSVGSFTFIIYQFIVVPLLFAAMIVPVGLMHGNATMLGWAWGLSYVLPLLPLWRYYRRITAFVRDVKPHLIWWPYVSFAGVGLMLWLTEYAARNLDMVLLGRMTTAGDAGIYAIAVRNATLCSVVILSVNAFFLPTISGLHSAGKHDELRALFRRTSLWIVIAGIPVIVYSMAVAEPLMRFFRPEFVAGAQAMWILAAGQLVNVGTGLVSTALSMTGRHQSVLITNGLGIVIIVGLCYWLIPIYGGTGAAMASALSVVFVNGVQIVWAYLRMGISPFSAHYVKPLIAAGLAGLATQHVVGLVHALALKLLGGLALFLALYLVLMLVMGMKEEALQAFRAMREGMNRRAKGPSANAGNGAPA